MPERRTPLPSLQVYDYHRVIDVNLGQFMSGQDMTHRMKPNACVRTSVHSEGAVFLHVEDARLFAANPVGADIWKGVERQLDADAIAGELQERYGAPYETTRAHVIRFIHELSP